MNPGYLLLRLLRIVRPRWYVAGLVVALVWSFASSAFAYNVEAEHNPPATGTGQPGTPISIPVPWLHKGLAKSLAGGGTLLSRANVPIPSPLGAGTATATAAAHVPHGGAALRLAARGLAAASGVGTAVTAGMLIYDYWDDLRIRADLAGGLVFDPGAPPGGGGVTWNFDVVSVSGSSNVFQGPYASSYVHSSAVDAATAHLRPNDSTTRSLTGYSTVSCNFPQSPTLGQTITCSGVVEGKATWFSGGQQTAYAWATVGAKAVEGGVSCPGGGAVDWDNKCPTGQFLEPMTPEEAAARAETFQAGGNPLSDQQWQDLIDSALGAAPLRADQIEGVTTGLGNVIPGTLTGPTTTTVNPDGSTVEDAITWGGNACYGLVCNTIAGGSAALPTGANASNTWEQTNTRTTRDAQGNVISTTVTTTEGAVPSEDACAADPGRLGCLGLGEIPTDAHTWENRPVTYALDSDFVGLPAGCPPALAVQLSAFSVGADYGVFCDRAPAIRAAFVLLTALSVGLFVVSVVGKG